MTANNTAFDQEQYDAIYPDGIENLYWQKARLKIILDILEKNKIKNLKYLEIGCGKGIVLQELRKNNIDTYGVELAKISALSAVEQFISTGISFTSLDEESRNEYTGVFLFDVIEHIEYPDQFILEIFKYYPNVKYVVLTVPSMKSIWSNYDEFNGHYKRYELEDLAGFTDATQTKILDQGYFFHSLYPMAKLLLKFNQNRSLEIKAPRSIGLLIHNIIATGFYYEYKLLSNNLSGSSLYFVLGRDLYSKTYYSKDLSNVRG